MEEKNKNQIQPGEERYVVKAGKGQLTIEYEYVDPDGQYFRCLSDTLENARKRRKQWEDFISQDLNIEVLE